MSDAPRTNYRRPVALGFLSVALLAGGLSWWMTHASISGAILAMGSVVVQGKPKSIQHLDGGIVENILVNPDDVVLAGDILVQLDDTTIAANYAIYQNRWRDALVRKDRLLAELRGDETFSVDPEMLELFDPDGVAEAEEQQRALMEARRLTRTAQLEQMDEQIKQFGNQIDGTASLIEEKTLQIKTFEDEAEAIGDLVDRQLVTRTRVMSLVRSQADFRGQIAEHKSEIARTRNAISETHLSKLQVEREFRERVVAELEKINVQIDELDQQIRATEQQLARTVIRAPVDGIVHELSLFTIGGVIQPGQTIMQIIPAGGNNSIELSVDIRSIDQIYVGARTLVRFPAFLQRTTPQLEGEVASLSPSSVVDEQTGASFYRITVNLLPGEIEKLNGKPLVPGMPVEGFIPTSERTVVAYLVKPLMDQLVRAFREE